MNKMQKQVKEFMIPGGYPVYEKPITGLKFEEELILPTGDVVQFEDHLLSRVEWLREEVDELKQAILANDIVEIADAIADLAYFVFGTAVSTGIDLEPVFDEVHRSNMAKFKDCPVCKGMGRDEEGVCTACMGTSKTATYRNSDGKLMKDVGWSQPNLFKIIKSQRSSHGEETKKEK